MVEVIGRYELRGNYVLDGREGSQVGEISYFSDNKLAGLVRDSNSSLDVKNPGYGKDKLLLGLHFPEQDSIAFLKLVPFNSGIAPVMWSAMAENPILGRDNIEGSYLGQYQFAMMWTPADDLQIILNRGITPMDEVKELDPNILKEIYFNTHNLDFLFSSGNEMGQTGKLKFRKL
ncbi:Uncharacterised protein [uncultured archaeon]|nr:Uncharacterised protein [uncultured archaeon]